MRSGAFILLFISPMAFAQFTYVMDQSIPVIQQDELLSMPWAGGLNATQFNSIDFNQDGNDDLAIFDRTSDRVVTFVRINNEYQYAPAFEILFPGEITNWMLLRDYNGDGRKDIFTGDNLGIKVYTNITPPEGPLQWEQFFFFTGTGPKSPVLLTKGFSLINLQLNFDDLPSISDMDGDGDLDLLVPKYPSGSTFEFHKNFSMDRYGTLDSLDFERTPQTPEAWGGVLECNCGVFAFNNQPCSASGRLQHTGGKSLFAFDADNDGDQDLMFSEFACNELFLLSNTGTSSNALITSASAFPFVAPVQILSYPAPYFEDVDFDGKIDLIASPNIFARTYLQTDFNHSVWFYKNTGTNALPVLAAPIQNFLQRDMIDIGDQAVPAFFDADADGDLDLFVGYYAANLLGSISYFENTGTPAAPAFKLITDDYHDISLLSLVNFKPSFADLNGDSKIDLVFTASNQFGGGTELYYFPNNSSAGANFSQNPVATDFLISSSENITIADVNRDGKNDLLVGKLNGSLQYWENTGTATNPSYTLENDAYLGLTSSVLRQNIACTTADLDADGKTDLILGDQTGKLTIVSDYREATDVSESVGNLIYNEIQETYTAQNLGGRVWPTVANLYKTDRPSIVVGNVSGGLHVLKHDESSPLPKDPEIEVYPNPIILDASSSLTVKIDRPALLQTLTPLGQEIGNAVPLQAFQEYSFKLPKLTKGIYFLRFSVGGKSYSRRIVVF